MKVDWVYREGLGREKLRQVMSKRAVMEKGLVSLDLGMDCGWSRRHVKGAGGRRGRMLRAPRLRDLAGHLVPLNIDKQKRYDPSHALENVIR